MIFPNEIFVKKIDTETKHREASIPDRPSMFYDRILAQEYKKNFVFIKAENSSENCNEEVKGKRRILKK